MSSPRIRPTRIRPARLGALRPMRRMRAALAAALALGAVATGVVGLGAAPAYAAGTVSVTVEGRPDLVDVADPTYLTQLRLNGSGFQSIVNGFGGIYVLFGWVDGGGWAPSAGGTTGTTYRYVPDDETNPVGYASFVSFPGSSTEYAANGGELAADGTWSAVLSVPGAQFTALDRSGSPTQVDCLQVQCGIITIGAHGVVNANNESFTPIDFRDLYSGSDAAVVPTAPETAAAVEAATPAPTTTTYVTEPAVAAAAAPTQDDSLVTIVLWVVVGVGVLAVAAIAFLVWAVLSGRRRREAPAGGPGSGPAAGGGTPAP